MKTTTWSRLLLRIGATFILLLAVRSSTNTQVSSINFRLSVLGRPTSISPSQGGAEIGVSLSGSKKQSTRESTSTTSTQSSLQPVFIPYLIAHTGSSLGTVCIAYRTYRPTNASAYYSELSYAGQMWNALLRRYNLCNTTSTKASPKALVMSLWTRTYIHKLSFPLFTIPPNYGLLNMPSYVVTKMPFNISFSDNTPLGKLVINATAALTIQVTNTTDRNSYSVGKFNSPGFPYPNGTIPIRWQQAGKFDITGSLVWTSTWSLGSSVSGSFAPITLTSTIHDFPVIALQAVRTQ